MHVRLACSVGVILTVVDQCYVADLIVLMQPPHKVDLGKPQKTILAQVVKSAIAIGVVDDYNGLGKLNLRELSSIVDEDEEAATEHKGTVDGNASKAANSEADVGAPDQDPKQGVNDESAAPAAASADGT